MRLCRCVGIICRCAALQRLSPGLNLHRVLCTLLLQHSMRRNKCTVMVCSVDPGLGFDLEDAYGLSVYCNVRLIFYTLAVAEASRRHACVDCPDRYKAETGNATFSHAVITDMDEVL